MQSGLIFNIQKYSIHDGPGIRTTVFLKGCPLNCAWCHNPEGISPQPEFLVLEGRCAVCGECRSACPFGESLAGGPVLPARNDRCVRCGECVEACPTGARQQSGRKMTVAEVMREVVRDRIFYEDSKGGVTVSGGEPLLQPAFLLGLLESCRAQGIAAALDTTGFGCTENLLAAAALSDLVLYDLKAFDDGRHRELTGVSNKVILGNLRALDDAHRNIWIRLPVVPGFNDDPADLARIAGFVAGLRNVTLVNLLPFHRTALHKWERLGRPHSLDDVVAPTAEGMSRIEEIFVKAGLNTRTGG